MDVGNCADCQALRDLHWDVQLRKSLHGRAVERERRWRRKAKEAEKQLRAQTAETERLAGQLEAAKAELVLLRQQWFGRKTERTKGAVEACAYLLDPSRSARVPREFLGEQAAGILSADRYSAYKTLLDMIRIAFCWAHVRRDFLRIHDGNKTLAPWAGGWVDQINALYRINRTRLAAPRDSQPFLAADRQLREALEQMAQRRDGELATATLHSTKRKGLTSLREHWSGTDALCRSPSRAHGQ
jgi:hypothetical protein